MAQQSQQLNYTSAIYYPLNPITGNIWHNSIDKKRLVRIMEKADVRLRIGNEHDPAA